MLFVMHRTVIQILIINLILTSCKTNNNFDKSKNEIEIGEYIFQFPKNFKLIKEKGIDSNIGKISNDKIEFQFDYGYFSNDLDKTIDEFLSQDVWKWNALGKNNILPKGDVTGYSSKINLLKYETNDSINYYLFYLYRKDTIKYNLTIPDEIRNTKFEIDTVENIVFKLVKSKKYVGMFIKNLNRFNKSLNAFKSLTIIVERPSKKETKKAIEIFKSCRLKK